MPRLTAFLFALRAVLKNLTFSGWLIEHLLFAIFGAVFALLRKRLQLPRWLLLICPALYILAETRLGLTQIGVVFPGWIGAVFSLNLARWALFFTVGEGIGWLIARIRKKAKV